ncbi:MAG TPA: hypothetical protein DIS76_07095 [Rhodospirillaceae bacterium]|nr:hypothetical protein [Rhodospirillaceae bacterium]
MNVYIVGSHATGEQNSRIGVANAIQKLLINDGLSCRKILTASPQKIYRPSANDETYKLWPDDFPDYERETVKGIPVKLSTYAKQLIEENGDPDIIIHSGGYDKGIKLALALKLASSRPSFLVNLSHPRTENYEIFDLVVNPIESLRRATDFSFKGVSHKVSQEKIDEGIADWAERLSIFHGRNPVVGVLVGGTIPNRAGDKEFTEADGEALGGYIREVILSYDASVIATNSRRTPTDAWRAFASQLDIPDAAMLLHDYKSDDAHNPYLAILGTSDLLIVTADSRSMLWEVSATGKPSYAFIAPNQQLESIHVENLEELGKMGMVRTLPEDPNRLDFGWKPKAYNPTSELAAKVISAFQNSRQISAIENSFRMVPGC